MRKILSSVVVLSLCTFGLYAAEQKRFDIYTDKAAPGNHFIPSGWMGDYGDLKFNDQETKNPASGTTCIKITYTAKRTQGAGWAGIYWQSSENDWGTKGKGYDLTGFNKLVFKAKGAVGGEVIAKVKVGGIIKTLSGEKVAFPDTLEVEYNSPIKLTNEWQEYSLNLVDNDLSYVNGGFCIVFNADQVEAEQTIYLDNIYYTYEANLKKETVKTNFPFYVYADSNSLDNHFIPSGWMGDYGDLKYDGKSTENPASGKSCIKITYVPKRAQGQGWAGIYWQNPANNWGTVPKAGFNLQGATKLTFMARGEKGGETINEFKIGGISSGEYIDSDSSSIGPVRLTKDWQKYEIDLSGKDLTYIIGGFCWATSSEVNDPEGIVFYLDEIRYEK